MASRESPDANAPPADPVAWAAWFLELAGVSAWKAKVDALNTGAVRAEYNAQDLFSTRPGPQRTTATAVAEFETRMRVARIGQATQLNTDRIVIDTATDETVEVDYDQLATRTLADDDRWYLRSMWRDWSTALCPRVNGLPTAAGWDDLLARRYTKVPGRIRVTSYPNLVAVTEVAGTHVDGDVNRQHIVAIDLRGLDFHTAGPVHMMTAAAIYPAAVRADTCDVFVFVAPSHVAHGLCSYRTRDRQSIVTSVPAPCRFDDDALGELLAVAAGIGDLDAPVAADQQIADALAIVGY